jgi:cytochrome c oxidase subunit 2
VPGFHGRQTPLDPAGPQALHIEHTLFLIFSVTSIVTAIVFAVLAFGVLRQHSNGVIHPHFQIDSKTKRRATWIVSGAIGITVILLFLMLISSFRTSHATAVLANSTSLKINVYGHEWWWEIEYPNEEQPYRIIRTANEIHVPVGTVIDIHGTSRDVIHSFWRPISTAKRIFFPVTGMT